MTSLGFLLTNSLAKDSASLYSPCTNSFVAFSKLACEGERSAACFNAASPASSRPRFFKAPPNLKKALELFGFSSIADCRGTKACSDLPKLSNIVPKSSWALGYSGDNLMTALKTVSASSKLSLRSNILPSKDRKLISLGSLLVIERQTSSASSRDPALNNATVRSKVFFELSSATNICLT